MADRTRNWTFIVYPESVVPNWRDILDDFHIEWLESPLHDKDLKEDGTLKKPHYHIVLMFGGVKSYEQVAKITSEVGGTIPQRVEQLRGMVRYLAHLDHPKKAQYSFDDIVCHGGADLAELCKAKTTDKYNTLKEIFDFCKVNEICEFTDLVDYAVAMHDDWLPIICEKHCYAISKYLDSIRYKKYKSKEITV